MESSRIQQCLTQLAQVFPDQIASLYDHDADDRNLPMRYWCGSDEEDVMVNVFQGYEIDEPFHRQDFFFVNYAYENFFSALSVENRNLVRVEEQDIYIGQPATGYALRQVSERRITLVGILIRKELFYLDFLPETAGSETLFRFFLEPQSNASSDNFIQLSLKKDPVIRSMVEAIVVEYAEHKPGSQQILKSMMKTLFMLFLRYYQQEQSDDSGALIDHLYRYISDHPDTVTLDSLAREFSYHPNYLSSLIRIKTGMRFSELVLQKRTERAILMMRHTDLSLDDISVILGYQDKSSFFKAFRKQTGKTPRQYLRENVSE